MGKKKQRNNIGKNKESSQEKEERIAREKKKHRNELLWTVILIAVGIVVVVMALWILSGAGKEPSQTVVFKVGDDEVYLDEVNLCVLQNVVNLGIDEEKLNTTAEDGSSADDYYKNEILNVIMDYRVEAKIAEKQGITLSDEEKKSIRSDAVEYMGEIDGRIMNELGITQDRVVEIYTKRYLAHALEETVTKDVEVENQKYCTMYMLLFPKVETNEEGDYVREEDNETPVMLSDEEIAKRKEDADAAYKELTEDGADIEDIAEKYGVSNVSGEESNLEESFGEPFSEYAGKLKEGEYSPVLDTASCYVILKMVKENNEEIAEQILEYYRSDLEKEAVEEQKTKWYEEAGVSEDADFVGNVWEKLSLYDFAKYVSKEE
ncbi:MAG: peptidyl-prolyl cis-trans isomerase [Lachnospiraceae bacterium]